ncbi:MAG: zinc-binding dehydrogenase [Planctomycetota bacterium]
MQQVRISAPGGFEALAIEDVERPTPGRGEVLVRVLAVSINHLDLWIRQGLPGVPYPIVPGCDGTAEVVELGEGVDAPPVGTLVLVEPGRSSGTSPEDLAGNDHFSRDYAIRGEHFDGLDVEYAAVEARFLRPLPAGLDPVTTAAAPLVFLTAWGMLVTRARLAAGETALILGGTSGVGSAGIQIAKSRGARVIATAGTEAKRALCSDLGADEVLDHRAEGWHAEVKRLTDGRGVDVVFEHIGPATWRGSLACLARNGRLVTCGATTGPKVELVLPHLFIKNQSILGSTMGPRSAFDEILERLADGSFRSVVDSILPLSEVRAAHERLERGDALGKLVLVPGA